MTLQETSLLAAKAAGANIDVAEVIAREETELQAKAQELRALVESQSKNTCAAYSPAARCVTKRK